MAAPFHPSEVPPQQQDASDWRHRMHRVIFETDTRSGKIFDVVLLVAIVLSVTVIMLESVATVEQRFGLQLRIAEWCFTLLFTVEYVLRLLSVRRPGQYARSFYGVIDLVSILPTYLSIVLEGSQAFLVLRALRLLRVFRVFKLARYVGELAVLSRTIRATSAKITVFLFSVLTIALVLGSLMYLIEGEGNGFTSIPRAVYWAIVTITTVGYGDIAPTTVPGQFLAAVAMVIGYSLIIIPAGIFSAEMVSAQRSRLSNRACRSCSREGHEVDARHCKYCGADLDPPPMPSADDVPDPPGAKGAAQRPSLQ